MEWNHIVPGLKEAMISAVNNNDWSAVRGYIENMAPKDCVEYTQLQQIPIHNNIIEESCSRGFTELVSFFLNNGFSVDDVVDETNERNETMLHVATREGHLSLVKLLLNSGANIDRMSNFGKSPLINAVEQGHLDIVNYLLIVGADVNTRSIYGDTALHVAAWNESVPVMDIMIKYGADVNITDDDGNTALHLAVLTKEYQTVKYLIDHGSIINSVNNRHKTPLLLSIICIQFDIFMLLINNGADLDLDIHNTVLHTAICEGAPIHMIECLLEHGANVTTLYYNKTALQFVISYSNYSSDETLKIAKLLLIYGSDHYVEDDESNTVLHWACRMGDVELVEYLINYTLDVDAKNSEGKKPIDIAHESGHVAIVTIIIEYHCNKYTKF